MNNNKNEIINSKQQANHKTIEQNDNIKLDDQDV